MDFYKLSTRVREFVVQRRKTVWGLLVAITLIAALSGGVVYYYNDLKQKNGSLFYNLVIKNINNPDTTAAIANIRQFRVDADNFLNNSQFMLDFSKLAELEIYLKEDDMAAVKTLIEQEPLSQDNQLFADLLKVETANILLEAKEYDKAASTISQIQSPYFEALQLLTLTKIYFAQNNLLAMQNNINELISKYPDTPLTSIAKTYLYSIK